VGTTILPIGYAGACAVASLVIALVATEYIVAATSFGTRCFGLYYILGTLSDNKVPATPQQRATAEKTFAEMIAMFQRRADELKSITPSIVNPIRTDRPVRFSLIDALLKHYALP
jgi:hypothetical protein